MRALCLVVLASLLPTIAWAKVDRKFGGCSEDLVLCAGPAASFSIIEFNLSEHTSRAGLIPGAGYELTLWPTEWWNVGFSIFLSYEKNKDFDRVVPAGVLSFAEYLRIGVGVERVFGENAALRDTDLLLLVGIGIVGGSSPGLAPLYDEN